MAHTRIIIAPLTVFYPCEACLATVVLNVVSYFSTLEETFCFFARPFKRMFYLYIQQSLDCFSQKNGKWKVVIDSWIFHEIVYKSLIMCIIIILLLSFIFHSCGSSELLHVCERNYWRISFQCCTLGILCHFAIGMFLFLQLTWRNFKLFIMVLLSLFQAPRW